MKVLAFLLIVLGFSFAQNVPQPFGLKLGESTKEEVERVVEEEGGTITESRYRVIKGNIVNPNVEGFDVEGLPVDNLQKATFWFYKGKLFMIVYTFSDATTGDFEVLYKQLEAKYGKPKKTQKAHLADGIVEWNFGNVKINLVSPWASFDFNMYLIYEHTPLSKQAEQNDREVFQRETSKPKRGL